MRCINRGTSGKPIWGGHSSLVRGSSPLQRQDAHVDRGSNPATPRRGNLEVTDELVKPLDMHVQLILTGLDFIDPKRSVGL